MYNYFCREFSNERTRVERRETFRKLRMKENFSKAFEGYFQWIIRAGAYYRSGSPPFTVCVLTVSVLTVVVVCWDVHLGLEKIRL